MKAYDLRITGRVQGVAFRAWTRDEALKRGVAGWVRNETDGSVAAHVEADEATLADFVRALHDGPGAADVRDVIQTSSDPTGVTGFEIRR